MRILSALLSVLVLFSFQASARVFKEIPLPNDIEINTAKQQILPADEAIFLGAWEGNWRRLHSIVIFTDINTATGEINGYYGWGQGRSFEPGGQAFTGSIGLDKNDDMTVYFLVKDAELSFRVAKGGRGNAIRGRFSINDGATFGMFKRTTLD